SAVRRDRSRRGVGRRRGCPRGGRAGCVLPAGAARDTGQPAHRASLRIASQGQRSGTRGLMDRWFAVEFIVRSCFKRYSAVLEVRGGPMRRLILTVFAALLPIALVVAAATGYHVLSDIQIGGEGGW